MRRASACKRGYIGFNGGGSDTSRVPHGEPYAGKLHVRFNEGYPPKNGEARFEGSRRPSGRTLRGRPALLYTLLDLVVGQEVMIDSRGLKWYNGGV